MLLQSTETMEDDCKYRLINSPAVLLSLIINILESILLTSLHLTLQLLLREFKTLFQFTLFLAQTEPSQLQVVLLVLGDCF